MVIQNKLTPSFPLWLFLLFICLWSCCESGGVVALNAKQIQFLFVPKVSERTVYSWTEFSPLAFHLSTSCVGLRPCSTYSPQAIFICHLFRTFFSVSSVLFHKNNDESFYTTYTYIKKYI